MNWSLVQLEDRSGKTTTVHCIDEFYFHGRHLPFPFGEHIEKVRNMEIRSDDVMIFSYPKSGTHWLYGIVNSIHHFDDREAIPESLHQPEFLPLTVPANIHSPRLLSSHSRPQFAPQKLFSDAGKIIYLERNPKAIAVSYYHMVTKIHDGETGELDLYDGTWDDYLEMFLNGMVSWGSWFDYVIDWRKSLDKLPKSKYLRITYEGLSQTPVSTIDEIATFLGKNISRQRAMVIAERCSFDNMKKREVFLAKQATPGDEKTGLYYRTGKVDDWKKWFTVAQEERFDAVFKQKLGQLSDISI